MTTDLWLFYNVDRLYLPITTFSDRELTRNSRRLKILDSRVYVVVSLTLKKYLTSLCLGGKSLVVWSDKEVITTHSYWLHYWPVHHTQRNPIICYYEKQLFVDWRKCWLLFMNFLESLCKLLLGLVNQYGSLTLFKTLLLVGTPHPSIDTWLILWY